MKVLGTIIQWYVPTYLYMEYTSIDQSGIAAITLANFTPSFHGKPPDRLGYNREHPKRKNCCSKRLEKKTSSETCEYKPDCYN